jgi:hypothetical protein
MTFKLSSNTSATLIISPVICIRKTSEWIRNWIEGNGQYIGTKPWNSKTICSIRRPRFRNDASFYKDIVLQWQKHKIVFNTDDNLTEKRHNSKPYIFHIIGMNYYYDYIQLNEGVWYVKQMFCVIIRLQHAISYEFIYTMPTKYYR